jgi:hypothetical protein
MEIMIKFSNDPGSLQASPNGEIFFKGIDNKMHWYYFDNGQWNHQLLNHPNNSMSDVSGDIVIDPATNNIFYRGHDNRLQTFWKDLSGNYNHAWVDGNWSTSSYLVKNNPWFYGLRPIFKWNYIYW